MCLLINGAGGMMAAGFVGAVHHVQPLSVFCGDVFTGNGLHSVAGTAKAGNVDFDDFRFHGKPPDQIDNYKCPFMIVHVFASAGNEKVAGKFLFTFPG